MTDWKSSTLFRLAEIKETRFDNQRKMAKFKTLPASQCNSILGSLNYLLASSYDSQSRLYARVSKELWGVDPANSIHLCWSSAVYL
jgi:hypothetical protein